jgi:hypothetical protein
MLISKILGIENGMKLYQFLVTVWAMKLGVAYRVGLIVFYNGLRFSLLNSFL